MQIGWPLFLLLCWLSLSVCKPATDPTPSPPPFRQSLQGATKASQNTCSQILGSRWNPANGTCQHPSTTEECQSARPSLVWDGAHCVEGVIPKNFYRLCIDAANQPLGIQKTIQVLRAPYGVSGCQAVSAQLILVTALDLGSNGIEDLSPLQSLKQIEKLILWNNKISDVGPLKELKQLTEVNLGKNQIQDVTALGGLSNLTTLLLFENQITSIKGLSGLQKLSTLNVENNSIADFHEFPPGRVKNFYNAGNPGSTPAP